MLLDFYARPIGWKTQFMTGVSAKVTEEDAGSWTIVQHIASAAGHFGTQYAYDGVKSVSNLELLSRFEISYVHRVFRYSYSCLFNK